ncbi:hypothetical protein Tco_0517446 [Tanacetum coccineum]
MGAFVGAVHQADRLLLTKQAQVPPETRYLAGEEVSDPDSPVPKLAKATKHKATKKSKPSTPKPTPVAKPAVSKASKSQQTKSAPTKP